MNNLIRFFALFVAVAGLACATFAPANPNSRNLHNSIGVTDPGPLINLPGPISCQEHNACVAPMAPAR